MLLAGQARFASGNALGTFGATLREQRERNGLCENILAPHTVATGPTTETAGTFP